MIVSSERALLSTLFVEQAMFNDDMQLPSSSTVHSPSDAVHVLSKTIRFIVIVTVNTNTNASSSSSSTPVLVSTLQHVELDILESFLAQLMLIPPLEEVQNFVAFLNIRQLFCFSQLHNAMQFDETYRLRLPTSCTSVTRTFAHIALVAPQLLLARPQLLLFCDNEVSKRNRSFFH